MKIVFLDIDGVLNLHLGHDGQQNHWTGLVPEKIRLLDGLLASAGAGVVVSSSWKMRGLESVAASLAGAGLLGRVLDITPDLATPRWADLLPGWPHARVRGHEIAAWIYAHWSEVESFVMLDDGRHTSGLPWIDERLVQTDTAVGLLPAHTERAAALLGRPML